MSFDINSISTEKSYASHENGQKSKKKRIISEKQGNFYCTYLIDEKGQKVLIKKVPIAQADEQKHQGEDKDSAAETNTYDYNALRSARTNFEFKQQMDAGGMHKKNLKKVMDILNEYVGICGKQ